MMTLQSWITGIAVTAILAALARLLTGHAAGRSVIRFFSGVCVVLALLAPLQRGLPAELARSLRDAAAAREASVDLGKSVSDALTLDYAAQQVSAYLQAQLAALDPSLTVSVTLDPDLRPASAELRGSAAARAAAIAAAATALGLTEDRIVYVCEEDAS